MVSETQCDLGLTALNLNDCLDLMVEDYPDKFKEMSSFLEDRRRRAFADIASNFRALEVLVSCGNFQLFLLMLL